MRKIMRLQWLTRLRVNKLTSDCRNSIPRFCIFALLLATLNPQSSILAQTISRKAQQYHDKALEYYESGQFQEALLQSRLALKEYPRYFEMYQLQAAIYTDLKEKDSTIAAYRHALDIDPNVHVPTYYYLAELELQQGYYAEAAAHLDAYLYKTNNANAYKPNASSKLQDKANLLKIKIDAALKMYRNPVDFKPENLGDSINTVWDEYLPTLTVDGKTLVITRRLPKPDQQEAKQPVLEEDFYISMLSDSGVWMKAHRMPEPISTNDNEGAQSISADGRYLYFSGCNRRDGYGGCDIYVSVKRNGKWSRPFNIGEPVNTEQWESQPCLAPDERTLYFASTRRGGYGGSDIWKTVLQDDGMWSVPENLGDSINTSGNETTPFIHYDNQTLYFSSNGHSGMGGMDVFYAKKKKDGTWNKPVNLGYPINTHSDEASLIVSADGKTAYFSSDKFGGKGRQDIYRFELYKEAQPKLVSYMEGQLLDENHHPVIGKLQVINLETGELASQTVSDSATGKYLLSTPTQEPYAINVSKEGYLFYSENLEITNTASVKPQQKDIELKPVKIGESIVLNNIFFEVNSYELRKESAVELEKLRDLLVKNPKIRIEISGHTDNTGGEAMNIKLSEQRAKAIYDYLVQSGIPASRLAYKGYGFRKPIASNDTEEGRAQNRRTEIKIIE